MPVVSTDDLHNTTDAMTWADTFCAVVQDPDRDIVIDQGLMLVWFANAMDAAESHLASRRPTLGGHAAREIGYCLHRVNDRAFHGHNHGRAYRLVDRFAGVLYNAGGLPR